MSLTWGEYRTIIRRTVLNDVDSTTWPSNDTLLDCLGWALDAFCVHTAAPTSVVYTSLTREIPVPDNLFSDLEDTGAFYLVSSSTPFFVPPLHLKDYEDTQNISFAVYGNTLTLTETPPTGATGKLYYFAYYNKPVVDADTIDIPRWALNAVAHLVGSYALSQQAMLIANINMWKSREDSGTPVQNAIEVQQRWMFKVYESELARFPNQNRENYYQRLIVV